MQKTLVLTGASRGIGHATVKRFGAEGWRASDSSPGRIIEYAESELKCWMPMPTANPGRASAPSPWEGDDEQQLDGAGILRAAVQKSATVAAA